MLCKICGAKDANEYLELCDRCRLYEYAAEVGNRVATEEARDNS